MPQHSRRSDQPSHHRSPVLACTLAMLAGACMTASFAQAQTSSAKGTTTKASTTSKASGVETVKNESASSGKTTKAKERGGVERLTEEELKARELELLLKEKYEDATEIVDEEGLKFLVNDVSYEKQASIEQQRSGAVVVTKEEYDNAKRLVEQQAEDAETGGGVDEDAGQLDCGLSPEMAELLLPATLNLTGTIRDFVGRQDDQGAAGQAAHPDFEVFHNAPPWDGPQYHMHSGAIINIAADELDEDEKPAFRSLGQMIGSRDWVSNDPGRPVTAIMGPRPYIQWKPTDTIANMSYPSCDYAGIPGQLVSPPPASREALESAMGAWDARAIVGPDTFAQWYRDVPGVNLSQAFTITLNRVVDNVNNSVKYVFDDRQDPEFIPRHGFYPINGALFGNGTGYNCHGQSVNNHFTFELDTTFIYKRGCGQVFTFNGDDDVWVFIDGKLVIDLSGTHCVRGQTIDLDRLTWLQDRRPYQLKFFSAERQRCGSNIRIETNLELRTVDAPQSTGLFD